MNDVYNELQTKLQTIAFNHFNKDIIKVLEIKGLLVEVDGGLGIMQVLKNALSNNYQLLGKDELKEDQIIIWKKLNLDRILALLIFFFQLVYEYYLKRDDQGKCHSISLHIGELYKLKDENEIGLICIGDKLKDENANALIYKILNCVENLCMIILQINFTL